MLNYLWAGMLLTGVIFGAFHGTLPEITSAALASAKEAVALSITMLGAMGFWMGIMEIGSGTGLLERLCRKLDPFLLFMFPGLKEDKKIRTMIATNFAADFLGLGWASTPAGLKAMEGLQRKSKSPVASGEMCTFLVLNTASVQLFSITMITYRSQYGSVSPAAIAGPSFAATAVSFFTAVIICRLIGLRERKGHCQRVQAKSGKNRLQRWR